MNFIIKIKIIFSIWKLKIIKEVCIQGLGYVGVATATAVALVKDKNRKPRYNVIGVELNNEDGLLKIESINSGSLYFACEDKNFKEQLKEAVIQNKNLKATYEYNVYKNADVVIVAIGLNVKKNKKNYFKSEGVIRDFKDSIRVIAKHIKPECLVLIETTIPPGTSIHIIEKILRKEFEIRSIYSKPLICHSYERIMPGKNYLDSVINNWRNFSANCEQAKKIAGNFLKNIIDVQKYPLTYFDNMNATEIAKILENSYRAVNIAFIYEWTLFAEKVGVNLFKIIDAIKKRSGTHDNMMKPGFGVGGYCLPKDSLLAQWSITNIFHIPDLKLNMSLEALQINDKMPLHTFNLIKEEFGSIEGKKILIFGASYLPDVGDLRNTPSKVLYDTIKKEGGICHIIDPYVDNLETIFDKEDIIKADNFKEYDVIVFSVRYEDYLNLDPKVFSKSVNKNVLLIDTFDILNDDKIKYFLKEKINVIGVGKGHIRNLKEAILWKKY